MANPADKTASYEDLFGIPDNEVGEILAGDLITHPRPTPKHSLAASMMGAELIREFGFRQKDGSNGDWWILDEPECHLAADIVVPNLAGWRKGRG